MNATITLPAWVLALAILFVLAWSGWLAYRAAFWRDLADLLVKGVEGKSQ